MSRTYTLTLSCPDRVGIVAAVSGLLAVLARGLRFHVQDRVLIQQNKTVVFE